MKKLILFFGLLASFQVLAEYVYDPATGNSYNVLRNPYTGQVQILGANANTRSTWGSTIEPNGYQHGTDSQGNGWSSNGPAPAQPEQTQQFSVPPLTPIQRPGYPYQPPPASSQNYSIPPLTPIQN